MVSKEPEVAGVINEDAPLSLGVEPTFRPHASSLDVVTPSPGSLQDTPQSIAQELVLSPTDDRIAGEPWPTQRWAETIR